jgi:catechol 2,3-dioxygenase-like lactoylglutathione lyase family enzyme
MTNLRQITPFLHVPDLATALDLFTRVLGFTVEYRESHYAYLERKPVAVRILEEPGRPLPAAGDKARMTVYIDVVDVDALYAELLPGLDTLREGDVVPPEDKVWGQREFHVRLPDGQWLSFGQAARSATRG